MPLSAPVIPHRGTESIWAPICPARLPREPQRGKGGAALAVCPKPVTGPEEVVAGLGSCVLIPCRYNLCQVGTSTRLPALRWLQKPVYDHDRRDYVGGLLASTATGATSSRARIRLAASPRPHAPTATTAYAEGDCSLVLSHVRAEDAGEYGLRLEANSSRSRHGLRWFHKVVLNVTDAPPAPHLWPDPQPLVEGRMTTLGCWVPPVCPEDTVTLAWDGPASKVAGAKVQAWTPPDHAMVPSAIGISLDFNPTWYHDKSNLSCLLRGADGKTVAQATRQLQVHYAPRDVRVEVMPASPVREGWEVTLSCHDSANPPSSVYSWSLNGLRLSSSTDKLLLRSAQVHDGGTYHCRATNAVGSVESHPTDLEVYYAPRDVRVEVTSPVCEGKEVTLKCRDSANPPSHTYAWILEGQILPHSSAQFRLWPVREVDGGSYRCQATNDIGTADSPPTFLEVYYQPRNATLTVLNPLPVLAGTRVSLHCELGPAHPPPSAILWLRNDRHQASTTGPIFSFTAEPTRASTYRCVGQNVAGFTQSPPLAVIVWYPPQAVWMRQSPRGELVAGRGPVWLHCEAGVAEPPLYNISWFKGGQRLPASGPRLLLPGPEPTDSGTYICEVRNVAGAARSAPTTLNILFGPRSVELVPDPGEEVYEMTSVVLHCRVSAQPLPDVFEWFRDGRTLGRASKDRWVLSAVGIQESGRYRCRATNSITSADSPDVTITVYYTRATILRKTFLGLGVGLGSLLLLGALGCFLRRRWQRQMAADEEPVVEPSGTFFLRNKKPQPPASPQPPHSADDTISYSSLVSPPGSGPVPRVQGDTVVYSVLKRNDGAAKATEGPDYENVPSGPRSRAGDRDGDRDGTLLYAALALSPPVTAQEHAGGMEDAVEYAALRH
uniref:B-cell receptor CD22 n=1 Tax=Anas zonorhyncha TaxID=75864 RepID=A0A8B9VV25_9AVES